MRHREDKTPQQHTAIFTRLYWYQSHGSWDFELKTLNTRARVICPELHALRAREYRRVLPVLTRGTTLVELKATGRRPVKHGA